jgi:hypothetical protein
MITSETIACSSALIAIHLKCPEHTTSPQEEIVMTAGIIVIAALVAWAAVSSVVVAVRDGYRRVPTIAA